MVLDTNLDAPVESYTVVFLLDRRPAPLKMVMLRRAAEKAFAPGLYTGVGGKIEPGETPLAGAYRELEEETGLRGIPLTAFAQCELVDAPQVNGPRSADVRLYYFVGILQHALPQCNAGDLEWVAVRDIFTKPIIPTTALVLQHWVDLHLAADAPFTVHAIRTAVHDGVAQVALQKVESGLVMG